MRLSSRLLPSLFFTLSASGWFLAFLTLSSAMPFGGDARANELYQVQYCQAGYGTPCPAPPCPPGDYYCSKAPTPAQCQGPSQDNCLELSGHLGDCGLGYYCSDDEPIGHGKRNSADRAFERAALPFRLGPW
jgi:hypothetical protein